MFPMKKLLLVVLIIMLTLAGVQADSTDRADLCGELPETDCQILVDNESVMNSLNSLAFSASLSMYADADEVMQLSGQGYGAFELDDEALQAVNEMSEDISETDLNALAELLLTSAKAEISFEVSGNSGDEVLDFALELRLKDGILLVGAEALEELTGESMTGVEALGVDLNGAIGDMLEETGALPTTDVSEMEAAEAAAISITRLADDEVAGVAVAVFETTIDLDTFFSLVSAEDLVAEANDVSDPEEVRKLIEAIDVRDFTSLEYIGLEDHYTYRMEMSLDVSIAHENYDMDEDASFVMDMNIMLSGFNEPVDVTIPEDAFVFPLAMLLQMGSQ